MSLLIYRFSVYGIGPSITREEGWEPVIVKPREKPPGYCNRQKHTGRRKCIWAMRDLLFRFLRPAKKTKWHPQTLMDDGKRGFHILLCNRVPKERAAPMKCGHISVTAHRKYSKCLCNSSTGGCTILWSGGISALTEYRGEDREVSSTCDSMASTVQRRISIRDKGQAIQLGTRVREGRGS